MAIPPNLELVAHGERPRSALARLYLEHERLAIGGGTLVAVLLLWEALGRSGLVDPLFISFPTQVAQAGWQLSHDRDFWNDVEVSATEFILGYGAALALAIPLGLAVGLSKRLQYMIGPFVDTLNAVPRVTLLPLIIIWCGIGIWSKVVVVFLGAVIPIHQHPIRRKDQRSALHPRGAQLLRLQNEDFFEHHPARDRALHLHRLEIRRRPRAARGRRRRALRLDGGPRPHDRRRRQYISDRHRLFRRARVHGHGADRGRAARRRRAAVRKVATRVEPIMTDAADGRRNSMSSIAPMRAANDELQMPAALRWYLAHERAILGTLVVMLFLIGWEGLERGWWADMLRPLLGASAERLQLKPIFISSPTLIAAAAFRMFFVTGEIWPDLAWSCVGYVLGLGLAIAVGIPLGLAAGWYRRFSYAVEPFLSALNATPQVAFLPLIVVWVGTGLGERVLIIFLLAVLPLAINAHAAVRTTDPRLVK